MEHENIKDFGKFPAICTAAALIFAYWLFGFTGIKISFAILIMSIPMFLLLSRLDISYGEKTVFSLILGITIFPSLVYILGFAVPFRIAIAIVFALLLLIFTALHFWKPRHH